MITLPQRVTTDTDLITGLSSGKTADSAQDFLALLAGALGAGDAQGKDAPLTLADLQAASGKLQKGLLAQDGDASQTVKLADLLAAKEGQSDALQRTERCAGPAVRPDAHTEEQCARGPAPVSAER